MFYIFIYIYVSWPSIVEDSLKASFSVAITPRCWGEHYSFPWTAPLTLDLYLIMLSVEQVGIKYHFLSLGYDLTRDWTLISRSISEHFNHYAKEPYIYMCVCVCVHIHTHVRLYIFINIHIYADKSYIKQKIQESYLLIYWNT